MQLSVKKCFADVRACGILALLIQTRGHEMQNAKETVTLFRDIPIGAQFDFIAPGSLRNSFYNRCTKISARKYSYLHNKAQPLSCRVGTVKARVYNVSA
jgi:hypothetical protein